GNSTTDPTGTINRCGSKLLLCCASRSPSQGRTKVLAGVLSVPVTFESQTTASEAFGTFTFVPPSRNSTRAVTSTSCATARAPHIGRIHTSSAHCQHFLAMAVVPHGLKTFWLRTKPPSSG